MLLVQPLSHSLDGIRRALQGHSPLVDCGGDVGHLSVADILPRPRVYFPRHQFNKVTHHSELPLKYLIAYAAIASKKMNQKSLIAPPPI
jgi:hypothetical protein